jgi:hypothetical protein
MSYHVYIVLILIYVIELGADKKLPRALVLGNTEQYVEYAEDGTLIKGQEKKILNSKYEEDKLTNNHTKVHSPFYVYIHTFVCVCVSE